VPSNLILQTPVLGADVPSKLHGGRAHRPGRRTSDPTASTSLDSTAPSTGCLGAYHPNVSRAMIR